MTAAPQKSSERVDGWLVLRALIKGFMLFALLNIVYGLVQPVRHDLLPTLYNGIVPGRERFEALYEFMLERMVDDHVIRQASPETYNIVFLGSSEVWGNATQAADAIPALVENQALIASDGRAVRAYNMAFPYPDGFKDLMIAQYLIEENLPIDLIILVVNYQTLAATTPHVIFKTNPTFAQHVIDLYNIEPYAPVSMRETDSFWAERSVVAGWIGDQVLSLKWLMAQRDRDDLNPPPMPELSHLDTLLPMTQSDILPAFSQLSAQSQIPVLVVAMAAPFERNVFSEWFQQETQRLNVPALDCSHLFTQASDFEDELHILPDRHEPLARALAMHLENATRAFAPGLPIHGPESIDLGGLRCEEI